MASTLITAVISFISTNLDDLFILMLFFSQISTCMTKPAIVWGQYLGIGVLIAISILGALGLSVVPSEYVGLLGFIPIGLGLKILIDYHQKKQKAENPVTLGLSQENEHELKLEELTDAQCRPKTSLLKHLIKPGVLKVASITIANGGDNIGIYVPLFTGMNLIELSATVLVFGILTALWCLIGLKLSAHPLIQTNIAAYQHIFVPIVFIGLGIYILMKNGTLFFIYDLVLGSSF